MKKKQWFFDMKGSLAAVGADPEEMTRMVSSHAPTPLSPYNVPSPPDTRLLLGITGGVDDHVVKKPTLGVM
jgi:hypothetical protein